MLKKTRFLILFFRKNYFFRKIQKMLLPTHEPVLNPKFGVVILKTATCTPWTHRHTHRQTDKPTCNPPYVLFHYNPTIGYAHICEKVQIHYHNRFAIWINAVQLLLSKLSLTRKKRQAEGRKPWTWRFLKYQLIPRAQKISTKLDDKLCCKII